MASAKNDGGPAFPQNDLAAYGIGPSEGGNGGMSLRDYFAIRINVPDNLEMKYAEALAGRLHPFPGATLSFANREAALENARFWADAEAALRYIQADAMLAARASGEAA